MSYRKLCVSTIVFIGAILVPFVLPGTPPEFEVASVRANTSGLATGNLRGSDRSRFSAGNITLNLLIRLAWNVREYQISGGPAWLGSDRFDISAKPEAPVDNDQMMLMLQKLLQDRFKLAIRQESRELPVYAIVPAKNGLKLHAGECVQCGSLRVFVNGLDGQVSMPLFVNVLSDLTGRPVTDETRFTGPLDVHLRWTPDGSTPGDRSGDSLPLSDDAAPSFFTAIEEQLGIKLEMRKGPVETIVIEHAEKPTGN